MTMMMIMMMMMMMTMTMIMIMMRKLITPVASSSSSMIQFEEGIHQPPHPHEALSKKKASTTPL